MRRPVIRWSQFPLMPSSLHQCCPDRCCPFYIHGVLMPSILRQFCPDAVHSTSMLSRCRPFYIHVVLMPSILRQFCPDAVHSTSMLSWCRPFYIHVVLMPSILHPCCPDAVHSTSILFWCRLSASCLPRYRLYYGSDAVFLTNISSILLLRCSLPYPHIVHTMAHMPLNLRLILLWGRLVTVSLPWVESR